MTDADLAKRRAILRAKMRPCSDCGRQPRDRRWATLDHTGLKRMRLGGWATNTPSRWSHGDSRAKPHYTTFSLAEVEAELAGCVPVCIWCHDRREVARGRLGPLGITARNFVADLRTKPVRVEHPIDMGPRGRALARSVAPLW